METVRRVRRQLGDMYITPPIKVLTIINEIIIRISVYIIHSVIHWMQ